MLGGREPVGRQGCLKSDYVQVCRGSNHGQLSAKPGDLKAMEAAHWMLGMAHILGNEIDAKSTGLRSLTCP